MQEREETRKRVKRTIAATLGLDIDPEEIPDGEPLFGDGGASSIASLELIAGLTAQQAKDDLVRVMEKDAMNEAAHLVKRIEDEARESANRNAQRILANAIQRNASDHVSETTVSVVLLPNDEMKGRLIGREGRNIRAIEAATGVDLIIDDTPEAVTVSCFDPIRRGDGIKARLL